MDSDKELELCHTVCGIYYTRNKHKTISYGDETFLESCLYNGAGKAQCITNCNCFMFEQYVYLRDWLSSVHFLDHGIQDESYEVRKNTLKEYLKNVCDAFFKDCNDVKQAKADFVCVIKYRIPVIGEQFECLASELNINRQQAQGLICLLHICVDILIRNHDQNKRDALFNVLYHMFFSDTSTSKLADYVQQIREKPKYFDFFAHIPDMITKGVEDQLDEQNVRDILDYIRETIMYLQGTELKLRTNRAWFESLCSLRDIT